jgi:hypothetical protein
VIAPLARLDARFAPRRRACPACLASIQPGRDSCGSCGTPLRGRFGPLAGPRSPSAIAAIGLALVAGVAGVGYVLLALPAGTPPGASTARAPSPVPSPVAAGLRTTAPRFPARVGATGPTTPTATSGALVAPKIPKVTPTPVASAPAPSTQSAPTPASAQIAATTAPAASPPASATTPSATAPGATIRLAAGGAATYNPYGAPAGSFGAAAKAIGGNPLSSWTYRLDPSSGGATKVGLVVDLRSAERIGSITLSTGSPGMAVEFYGASGPLPGTITDRAWVHLASRTAIGPQMTVGLGARDKSFDHVLIWITHAPPGVNAGALSISDVSLTG